MHFALLQSPLVTTPTSMSPTTMSNRQNQINCQISNNLNSYSSKNYENNPSQVTYRIFRMWFTLINIHSYIYIILIHSHLFINIYFWLILMCNWYLVVQKQRKAFIFFLFVLLIVLCFNFLFQHYLSVPDSNRYHQFNKVLHKHTLI